MLANATEAALDVDVALLATGGTTLATRRVPLGPLSFAQLNVANELGVPDVAGATFLLSTPTTGGRFAAYASTIDQKTGDPRTLLPGAVGGGAWLLPSSARAPGVGAFWTTDLTLRNTGTAAMLATVKFLGHSGDGRNRARSGSAARGRRDPHVRRRPREPFCPRGRLRADPRFPLRSGSSSRGRRSPPAEEGPTGRASRPFQRPDSSVRRRARSSACGRTPSSGRT